MTEEEIKFLNGSFANNPVGLKALRKLFLYEVEMENPLGMARDMWTTLDLTNMSAEDRVLAVTARQMMIRHIEGALTVLATIAGDKVETQEEIEKRMKKNSNK